MRNDDSIRAAVRGADERTYFEGRAQSHRDRAKAAQDSATRDLHLRFAKLYATRAVS